MVVLALLASLAQQTADVVVVDDASAADAGRVTVGATVGMDTGNAYLFRGIAQTAPNTLVDQPYGELALTLPGVPLSPSVAVGAWSSVHPFSPSGDAHTAFYETDLYLRGSVAFGGATLSGLYTFYASPNAAFASVHELGASLAYNDAPFWDRGGFKGLQPQVVVAREIAGTAFGTQPGTFYAVSLKPAVIVFDVPDIVAVDVNIPVEVGGSAGGYYDGADGGDDVVGYGTVGLGAVASVAAAPVGLSFALTARAFMFGDHVAVVDGQRGFFVVSGGPTVTF